MDVMNDPAPWWAPYSTNIAVALVGAGVGIGEIIRRWASGHTRAEVHALQAQADKTESETRTPEERANTVLLKTIEALSKQIEQAEATAAARDAAATRREQELLARIDDLERMVAELKREVEAASLIRQGFGT
jgi:hypothetical protein